MIATRTPTVAAIAQRPAVFETRVMPEMTTNSRTGGTSTSASANNTIWTRPAPCANEEGGALAEEVEDRLRERKAAEPEQVQRSEGGFASLGRMRCRGGRNGCRHRSCGLAARSGGLRGRQTVAAGFAKCESPATASRGPSSRGRTALEHVSPSPRPAPGVPKQVPIGGRRTTVVTLSLGRTSGPAGKDPEKVPKQGSARRRLIAIGIAVLAFGVAAPAIALSGTPSPGNPGAAPRIANPGAVNVELSTSLLTPKLALEKIAAEPGVTGTVSAVGGLRIAKSDLTFAPVTVDVDGLGKVVVQTVAVSDLRGVINPTTGVVTLTVALAQRWTQDTKLPNCPVGPFVVKASTESAGATPYDALTGTATGVDATFELRAIAPGIAGCAGLEGTLNDALSLPITTTTTTSATATTTVPSALPDPADIPVPAITLSITMSPPPVAPVAPPTTVAPTTVPHTTPATVTPKTPTPAKAAQARPAHRPTVTARRANKFLRDVKRRDKFAAPRGVPHTITTPTTRPPTYKGGMGFNGQASPPAARQPTKAVRPNGLATARLGLRPASATRLSASPWLIALTILALASMLLLGIRLIAGDLGAPWAPRHVRWTVRRRPPS